MTICTLDLITTKVNKCARFPVSLVVLKVSEVSNRLWRRSLKVELFVIFSSGLMTFPSVYLFLKEPPAIMMSQKSGYLRLNLPEIDSY